MVGGMGVRSACGGRGGSERVLVVGGMGVRGCLW